MGLNCATKSQRFRPKPIPIPTFPLKGKGLKAQISSIKTKVGAYGIKFSMTSNKLFRASDKSVFD